MKIGTSIRKVKNFVEPDRPWCLMLQNASMRGPGFYYYRTKEQAEAAASVFHKHNPKS